MSRIPDPPSPGPSNMGRSDTRHTANAGPPASNQGAPAWAVLLITIEASVAVCMTASVMLLALFGDQLAQRVGGAAATAGAGAVPMASASTFYYLLDRHDYSFAQEALAADLASDYTPDRLREEWRALEEAEGRTLPLPTNVQLKGNRATVSLLLSAARTNRTFGVELTLEQSSDETWYIVGADPSLIPAP